MQGPVSPPGTGHRSPPDVGHRHRMRQQDPKLLSGHHGLLLGPSRQELPWGDPVPTCVPMPGLCLADQ